MSLKEEIRKAIGAHGMWKARLLSAIDAGKSEFTPEKVMHDNECDFGKWLYGSTITPTAKASPYYETIRKLHKEFHQATGNVLKLALEGKKEEARKLIADNSQYVNLSSELTRNMMKWAESAD